MKTTWGSLVAALLLSVSCSSSPPWVVYCHDAGYVNPNELCSEWVAAVQRLCVTDGGCSYGGGGVGCHLVDCSTLPFCWMGYSTQAYNAVCNPSGSTDLALVLDAGSCADLSSAAFAPTPVCDGLYDDAP